MSGVRFMRSKVVIKQNGYFGSSIAVARSESRFFKPKIVYNEEDAISSSFEREFSMPLSRPVRIEDVPESKTFRDVRVDCTDAELLQIKNKFKVETDVVGQNEKIVFKKIEF